MGATPFAAVSLIVLAVPVAARGQELPQYPTPEEYAERADRAARAPLFSSDTPLKVTLRTDIQWLRDERNDSVEVEGTLTFVDLDGQEVTKPVDVRTRGNFRRAKRNCNFPPLRLDVPTRQMAGTVFEGQDKLKLVTPCQDGSDSHQNYIFLEYLAYKTLEILTPVGYRTRLVEITYEDIEGDYDTRTKYGFLIEDSESMAERNRATFVETTQFHPSQTDGDQSVLVAMFNFLIANTDWSPVFFHNVELIRTEEGRHLTVPYDFDWSGVVNARYATPDPALGIRNVTQRLFRGFCRPELQQEKVAAVFNAKKADIWSLYEGFDLMEQGARKKALEYYEKFYEIIDDPKKFEREVTKDCRSW